MLFAMPPFPWEKGMVVKYLRCLEATVGSQQVTVEEVIWGRGKMLNTHWVLRCPCLQPGLPLPVWSTPSSGISSCYTITVPLSWCDNYPLSPAKIIPTPLGYSFGWRALILCNLFAAPLISACLGRNPRPAITACCCSAGCGTWCLTLLKTIPVYLCQAAAPWCSATCYCTLHLSSVLMSSMNVLFSLSNHWQAH